ncbi:MAG: hydroxymethylpyrimidine/phosphomethylpyrimidine kinase [Gammaproteobacteria bacterium]|nr:hydroxymethylpyrimidine/phosphomethylpyrimidine kinase [Gammaproteobacteria bacterium]
MDRPARTTSTVLAISAHDPTGAAGLQADIETINSCGCRCASLLTATTAQNTAVFEQIYPQPLEQLRRQAAVLMQDMTFDACKIGMLGSAPTALFVADLLEDARNIPIILDPIMATGTGVRTADDQTVDALKTRLLPLTTVATPNCGEARTLSGTADIERAADVLLRLGARNVLITGGDEPTPTVVNVLFRQAASPLRYEFVRLPHRYHGSGCTLASAIAAFLARGMPVEGAVPRALEYTWRTLKQATRLGAGQYHPRRAIALDAE